MDRLRAGDSFGQAQATDTAEIRLWDPATGRDRWIRDALPGTVQCVAFSPVGTRIALVAGTVVHLKNATTGQLLATLKGHTGWIPGCAFSRDSSLIPTSVRMAHFRPSPEKPRSGPD